MSRAHRLRATCLLSLATVLGCHLIGGAGDLEFTDGAATGGSGGSAGSAGSGGATGGGGQGGSTTCGNGQVDPGEVCFPEAHVAHETGKRAAVDMVVLDCNGDDLPDVITADEDDRTLTVLVNDGAGAFQSSTSIPSGITGPIRITLAELRGGGLPELLLVGVDDGVADAFVEFSIVDCELTQREVVGTVTGATQDVAVVRFGNDALADPVATVLVGSNPATPRLAHVNNTNGSYPLAEAGDDAETLSVAGIAAGDLDGDERTDVAYVDPEDDEVIVRVNVITGFGQVFRHAVGAGPTAVAMGNLDGQPGDDVVVANTADSSLSILLNGGAKLVTKSGPDLDVELSPGVPEGRPRDVHFADLDGDGDLDILTANSNDSPIVDHSSVSLFLNDGDGAFQLATQLAFDAVQVSFPLEVGLLPSKVWAADMNGDGALDIVTSGTLVTGGTSHVSVLLAVP